LSQLTICHTSDGEKDEPINYYLFTLVKNGVNRAKKKKKKKEKENKSFFGDLMD
tara:strand:- start:1421 stop:1582 length:162 start_codon:yes stop_codon:yes gene_type:complete